MRNIKLVVIDVDFTCWNWAPYLFYSTQAMLKKVSQITGISVDNLKKEAKEVFYEHGTLEYPFLIQSLPSVKKCYAGVSFEHFLEGCLHPAMNCFKEFAKDYFRCFPTVPETLREIHSMGIPIAVLTDAPRYVVLWRLKKLGLLDYLDSVWGLEDPRLPVCEETGKVLVSPETLHKHNRKDFCGFRGHTEILPADYEKPDKRGLSRVLLHYDLLQEPHSVLWVGDNPIKDVAVGKAVGVCTIWAEYGVRAYENEFDNPVFREFYASLAHPAMHAAKGVRTMPVVNGKPKAVADYQIEEFAEILRLI